VQELATRPDGFTPLPSTPGGLALDFIRANLFDRTKLRAVPATAPGPTTTWPTSSTTSWRGPRPTRRQGSTPSASGGGPNRAHATRCSGSHPATGSTTIAGPEPGDPQAPDHTVRIVAALVNPVGPAPEAETVTVVNASSGDIDLTGWSILDREKRRLILDAGTLPAGDALRIRLGPPVALGNSGGLITLLNPDGLKVDGVAYTKAQATPEGRSLIF
jgi:Lamin Tail Domain/Uncharacterized conserved protein (DUF2278)